MNKKSNVKPNLFIVGAGKSGTFFLYEYLKCHPDIYMPEVKEPNFFGADLHFCQQRRSLDEYMDLYSPGADAMYRGDASVNYLLSKQAAQEIYDFNPIAKIIIIIRNPVEVLFSRHNQNVKTGIEPIKDFRLALEAERIRRESMNVPIGTLVKEWLFYREWVRFSEQIKRYTSVFPANNVYLGLYDDLKSDSTNFCHNILKFLGVSNTSFEYNEKINQSVGVRSILLQRILMGYAFHSRKLGKILVPSRRIRHILRSKLSNWNVKEMANHEIDADLKNKLRHELATEIKTLQNLFGRDLSHWLEGKT